MGLLGSVLLWYRDVQASKRQEAAEEADPDKPIERAAEDILNRSAVVGSIVRAVVSDFVPVLAVTGAYGDGKTSVLNLLAKQLELRDDVVFVRFSTWLSMDDKRWCRQLLSSVVEKPNARLFVPRIKKNFVEFTRIRSCITLADAQPSSPIPGPSSVPEDSP